MSDGLTEEFTSFEEFEEALLPERRAATKTENPWLVRSEMDAVVDRSVAKIAATVTGAC